MIKKFNEIINEGKGKKYTEKEIKKAVNKADDCFWKCIADEFTEIETGDFSPESAFALTIAMEKAVKEWLNVNK